MKPSTRASSLVLIQKMGLRARNRADKLAASIWPLLSTVAVIGSSVLVTGNGAGPMRSRWHGSARSASLICSNA